MICNSVVVLVTFLASFAYSFLVNDLPEAKVQLLSPGIEFRIPDVSGLQEVGVHYSVNQPLSGAQGSGAFNYEIVHKSADGYWHHRNTGVQVHSGDIVYYWLYYKINGMGQVKTDMSYLFGSGSSGTGHVTSSGGFGHTTFESFTNSTGLTSQPPMPGGLQLIFEDTFDNGFDKSKWTNEISAFGGGNWEFQIYSPEPTNTFVRNGVLYLKPTTTAEKFGENFLHHGVLDVRREWGYCTKSEFYGCLRNSKDAMIPPIMSSKVISKVSFKYGRVEVVAQMPIGDWIWPAIWLMPKEEHYGGWPMSGEIDMVETRCNRQFGDIGIQRMMSTLHWGPHWDQDPWQKTTAAKHLSSRNWGEKMHKYTMDWNEDHIILSVDDEPVLTANTPHNEYWGLGGFSGSNLWSNGGRDAPFDREFYLQMNTAVGGTNGFFPDGVQNAGYNKPWANNDPKSPEKFWNARNLWMPTWHGDDSALKIDSVRIWKKV